MDLFVHKFGVSLESIIVCFLSLYLNNQRQQVTRRAEIGSNFNDPCGQIALSAEEETNRKKKSTENLQFLSI